jgi:RNA ligase
VEGEGNRMKISLVPINERIAKGLITSKAYGDLAIFNYTNKCVYENKWDYWTKMCRGLIVNLKTQEIVALPFPKFFNLNENFETTASDILKKFNSEEVEITDKIDGSLGILFYHRKKFMIATRGSFESEQAKWATKFFNKQCIPDIINVCGLNRFISFCKANTLLFEIVYNDNRNVVDYDYNDLILIGCKNTKDGYDYSYDELEIICHKFRLFGKLVKIYEYSFDELLNLQQNEKGIEGFVLRFPDGYRVKIKTDEYVKLAKLFNYLSPLSVWEALVTNNYEEYEKKFPDDIKPRLNEILNKLQDQVQRIIVYTNNIYFDELLGKKLSRKKVAKRITSYPKILQGALFCLYDIDSARYNKLVWKVVKPVGNKFIDINRILNAKKTTNRT